MSKAITLRNIPPKAARRIEQMAKAEGISLNKAVLRLLQNVEGGSIRKRQQSNLAQLSGTWSKEEADAFDRFLAEERSIEPYTEDLSRKKNNLDQLAGGWSKEEVDKFDQFLADSRRKARARRR